MAFDPLTLLANLLLGRLGGAVLDEIFKSLRIERHELDRVMKESDDEFKAVDAKLRRKWLFESF